MSKVPGAELRRSLWRLALAPMLIIILANALLQGATQDVIGVGQGYGWDGVFYGELAENFPERFEELLATQSGERRQRVLPSILVSFVVDALPGPRHEAVIQGFRILNTLCLGLSVLVWLAIAERGKFSLKGAWLGFFALFINYQNLKFAYYYPVLTDSTTFLFALLLYWNWLRSSRLGIAVTLLLGSFTWSSFLLLFAPLLVMRKGSLSLMNRRESQALAAFVSFCLLGLLIYLGYIADYSVPENWRPPLKSLYPLSISISVAYVFLLTRSLFLGTGLFFWKELKNRWDWDKLLIVGVVHGFALWIIAAWPYDEKGAGFLETFAYGPNSIPFRSLNLPFVFGLAHFFYWGPCYFLVLYTWRDLGAEGQKQGAGMVLFLWAFALLSLSYETRHLLAFLPVLIGGLVTVWEQRGLSWSFVMLFGASSALISRFWLPIDSPNILPQLSSLWPG